MYWYPPLSNRTFCNWKPLSAVQANAVTSDALKQYECVGDDETMRLSMAEVSKGVSIRRARSEFNLSKSTLRDRVSGRVIHSNTSGPPKPLTTEEELVKFLSKCAENGYGCSHQELIALVQAILEKHGVYREVSYGRWDSFRRRHPQLTLRTSGYHFLLQSGGYR